MRTGRCRAASIIHCAASSGLSAAAPSYALVGAIIAVVSCQKGLTCQGGAEGVGRATTEAVVAASISILIVNFFLTLFLARIFNF